jgi:hypothetical protein
MPGSPWTSALRIKRKGDPDSEGKRLASANENTNSDREAFLAPRSAFFYWLLQSDQKPLEPQKRFVKNPLFLAAFGQNKTLKLCQNNVVINTRGNGRRRSWQRTVTTERTRQRRRGSGAAGTGVTGERIGRGIRPTQRRIGFVRESGTESGDQGQRLQRWTS